MQASPLCFREGLETCTLQLNFLPLKQLNRLDRSAGLMRKPAVEPRFIRFIPARLRDRSSALTELAGAPVPVFPGRTSGPVRFFKL